MGFNESSADAVVEAGCVVRMAKSTRVIYSMPMMSILATLALLASPIIYKVNFSDDTPVAVRPMEKSLLGFSLKQINDFRRESAPHVVQYSGDYCYLEGMRKDAIALLARDEQQFLQEAISSPDVTFDMLTKSGIRLTVGIYEKCVLEQVNDQRWGSLLIATKDGKLIWANENPGLLPLYMFRSDGPHLAILSSCMECGHVIELYFDPINQKFYTQDIGD